MDNRFTAIAKFIPSEIFNPTQVTDWSVMSESFGGASYTNCDGERVWLSTDFLFNGIALPPQSHDSDGLLILPYLFRRFGAPAMGCDPYKQIADYHLTTPHPSVFLRVDCKVSKFSHCLGIGLGSCGRDLPLGKIYNALSVTAAELCRPVDCRDSLFNIFGRVIEDDGSWDDSKGGDGEWIRELAETSSSARYGWKTARQES